MNTLFNFLNSHIDLLFIKLLDHVSLVAISTVAAILVGIPLGIFVTNHERLKTSALNIAGVLQTIPSLAMLVFLLPLVGIGPKPAIIALTIYALLPILQNTVLGLEAVELATLEAADGVGFTRWQRLWMIELPLAVPMIVGGVRTAITINVGTATLAAFIGAGGLGDFITQGLALNDNQLILLGAIPAALLALIFDFLLGTVEKILSKRGGYEAKCWARRRLLMILVLFLAIAGLFKGLSHANQASPSNRVSIGTKNSSEQFVLGEMMAQMIEAHSNLTVIRRFNLGSIGMVHAAIVKGDIDLYPEYTGAAYYAVLKAPKLKHGDTLEHTLRRLYVKKYRLKWLKPLGFTNSQSLIVRKLFAQQYRLNSISDLITLPLTLEVAAPAAFKHRPDALPGLEKAYGIHFKKVTQMSPALMYRALANYHVDIIYGSETDPRIDLYHLKILKDDRKFLPSYEAAPVMRLDLLKTHPEIKEILERLHGQVSTEDIRMLNDAIELQQKDLSAVVYEFLHKRHLL